MQRTCTLGPTLTILVFSRFGATTSKQTKTRKQQGRVWIWVTTFTKPTDVKCPWPEEKTHPHMGSCSYFAVCISLANILFLLIGGRTAYLTLLNRKLYVVPFS